MGPLPSCKPCCCVRTRNSESGALCDVPCVCVCIRISSSPSSTAVPQHHCCPLLTGANDKEERQTITNNNAASTRGDDQPCCCTTPTCQFADVLRALPRRPVCCMQAVMKGGRYFQPPSAASPSSSSAVPGPVVDDYGLRISVAQQLAAKREEMEKLKREEKARKVEAYMPCYKQSQQALEAVAVKQKKKNVRGRATASVATTASSRVKKSSLKSRTTKKGVGCDNKRENKRVSFSSRSSPASSSRSYSPSSSVCYSATCSPCGVDAAVSLSVPPAGPPTAACQPRSRSCSPARLSPCLHRTPKREKENKGPTIKSLSENLSSLQVDLDSSKSISHTANSRIPDSPHRNRSCDKIRRVNGGNNKHAHHHRLHEQKLHHSASHSSSRLRPSFVASSSRLPCHQHQLQPVHSNCVLSDHQQREHSFQMREEANRQERRMQKKRRKEHERLEKEYIQAVRELQATQGLPSSSTYFTPYSAANPRSFTPYSVPYFHFDGSSASSSLPSSSCHAAYHSSCSASATEVTTPMHGDGSFAPVSSFSFAPCSCSFSSTSCACASRRKSTACSSTSPFCSASSASPSFPSSSSSSGVGTSPPTHSIHSAVIAAAKKKKPFIPPLFPPLQDPPPLPPIPPPPLPPPPSPSDTISAVTDALSLVQRILQQQKQKQQDGIEPVSVTTTTRSISNPPQIATTTETIVHRNSTSAAWPSVSDAEKEEEKKEEEDDEKEEAAAEEVNVKTKKPGVRARREKREEVLTVSVKGPPFTSSFSCSLSNPSSSTTLSSAAAAVATSGPTSTSMPSSSLSSASSVNPRSKPNTHANATITSTCSSSHKHINSGYPHPHTCSSLHYSCCGNATNTPHTVAGNATSVYTTGTAADEKHRKTTEKSKERCASDDREEQQQRFDDNAEGKDNDEERDDDEHDLEGETGGETRQEREERWQREARSRRLRAESQTQARREMALEQEQEQTLAQTSVISSLRGDLAWTEQVRAAVSNKNSRHLNDISNRNISRNLQQGGNNYATTTSTAATNNKQQQQPEWQFQSGSDGAQFLEELEELLLTASPRMLPGNRHLFPAQNEGSNGYLRVPTRTSSTAATSGGPGISFTNNKGERNMRGPLPFQKASPGVVKQSRGMKRGGEEASGGGGNENKFEQGRREWGQNLVKKNKQQNKNNNNNGMPANYDSSRHQSANHHLRDVNTRGARRVGEFILYELPD